MNNQPRVSMVICTKNRAEQLHACLLSLNTIETDIIWELIVVNNDSSDNTHQIIEDFKSIARMTVKNANETIRGSGAAKNTGWKLAKGEYIAFIDDDCYPQTDFIDTITTILDENEQLGFTGGRVLLFDPTDLPITIQTHNSRIDFNPYDYIATGLIHGANFAFRLTAIKDAGGFDPRFGAGRKYPCEDVDIMAEILRHGWEGAYDPRAVVFHHHKRKLASESANLAKGYDKGRGAYFAKRLLKSGTRTTYLIAWLKRFRWQPIAVSIREISAALEFWFDNLTQKEAAK